MLINENQPERLHAGNPRQMIHKIFFSQTFRKAWEDFGIAPLPISSESFKIRLEILNDGTNEL